MRILMIIAGIVISAVFGFISGMSYQFKLDKKHNQEMFDKMQEYKSKADCDNNNVKYGGF